jgi:Tfp pilus assembly protein PilF
MLPSPRSSRYRSARFTLCFAVLASPAMAGMTQDLEDCTAADRKTSADACTRVMNSGRLPREQVYIGYFNRAWSYFNAGAHEKALADFDKSITSNPAYADTYFSRAVVQHKRGARDQSLADLDLYLEKKGETAEAHRNRAQVFRARAEYDRAFSELQRATALDPADAKAMAMRAIVLSDLGEQAPAQIEADKAVAAKPDEAIVYYARAYLAVRAKSFDAATTDVDKAISLKGSYPQAHTLKGEIQEERGDTSGAIASYRRAVEISSKSIDARASQDKARGRLSALGEDVANTPAKVAASTPIEPEREQALAPHGAECRRFIPSARTTVAVDCPK